ncbi:putative holin-like toxin [Mammaliicoccus sciuri]|uniref:putative holin-like toxin n=1 Tax=Mammaliicoccus sciuri TaxID=1296 RepID=UPI0034DD9BC5
MVPISDALNLMFSFGSFIVLLLGLVIAIVKLNQIKTTRLTGGLFCGYKPLLLTSPKRALRMSISQMYYFPSNP